MADIVDLDIEALSTGGDGIARLGARRIFVPFTIAGERVRARVPRISGDVTASLVDVLRPSPHRVAPPCPHFGPRAEPGLGPCGGCAWQHVTYAAQLAVFVSTARPVGSVGINLSGAEIRRRGA